MKKLIAAAISLAVLAAAIGGGFLAFGNSSAEAAADPNIVVVLRGLGATTTAPSGVPGVCFETDLYDATTDRIIGKGTDCIDIIVATSTGISVNRTTIFNFPQGELRANGTTTVVPIFGASSPDYTHVVGDVDDTTLNIISGTKRFAGRTGNVRLSGIVNLGDFPNTILFNCIFIIDLD